MIDLTPFSFSGILIVLTNTPLLIFLLLKGNSRIVQIYALHILCVLLWGVGAALIGLNNSIELAPLLWKPTYIAVLFIPVLFQHAVLLIINKQYPLYKIIIYTQATIFSFLFVFNKMGSTYVVVFESFVFQMGASIPHILAMVAWIFIVTIAQIQLILHHKKTYPQEKAQFIALICSIFGFMGGLSNFMLSLNIQFYPYGNFMVPLHAIIVSYAIFKHHLLDINIAISKSIAYPITIGIISLIYLLSIFYIEFFLQNIFNYNSLIIKIITAFVLGLVFLPLRHKIQSVIDYLFFRGTQEEIAFQNKQLRLELAQIEKLKTLSIFSSGIAHEVKNPLTALKTFTEFLPSKLNDKVFLKRFSRIIGHEVDRINDLVHQLMDYGRPAPVTLKDTNIYKTIDDCLDILNSKFIEKKINIIRNYPLRKTTYIKIDSNQIKQALFNIFINSIEAIAHGGELSVTAISDDTNFFIIIKDTGQGIASKDLPHIFDPFYSSKDINTGLGLSITQTIIEQHKGKIKVKSTVGVGTEFTIELPLHS